jgi:hypothetical protein
MKTTTSLFVIAAAALVSAAPALAQNTKSPNDDPKPAPAAKSDSTTPARPAAVTFAPTIEIQHIRPVDRRGLNVFESPKADNVKYDGFKLAFGAAFTQQFQNLTHENTAAPKVTAGVDANKLINIGPGFNNAVANMYLNAQLAPGIRVAMTSFLSARHHNETWVKDGYLLIDESPIKVAALENLMKYVTVRAGHFEVNYGDSHFRRTDNGNAIYNPLVGNYIMDAFTTEVGGEIYFRNGSWLAMGGITGGEVRGMVTNPAKRAPTYLGKLGFDRQLNNDLRVRLTGSMYSTYKSNSNTLYSGDRAGSRYYDVLENTASTEAAQAWSGAIQPGLSSKVQAYVINPFIKYQGLELFGNIETVAGRTATETKDRTWTQNVAEALYRFAPNDQLYVAFRYNNASGRFAGMANDVDVDRTQFGGGWFLTTNVLLKGEWVHQNDNNFPSTDIRNGGKFKGFVVEGVVAF